MKHASFAYYPRQKCLWAVQSFLEASSWANLLICIAMCSSMPLLASPNIMMDI